MCIIINWDLNSTMNSESQFRSVEVPQEALQQFTVFSHFTCSESCLNHLLSE